MAYTLKHSDINNTLILLHRYLLRAHTQRARERGREGGREGGWESVREQDSRHEQWVGMLKGTVLYSAYQPSL